MDKYSAPANPELHAAMVGKRTSSAASPHADRRTRRERARRDSKRAAIARSIED